jgi:transcriptional regulator with XRE-family HTH domain
VVQQAASGVRRRLIGLALRQYRENLAYTLGDTATILRCDRSKVSRVETGERGIRGGELLKLLEGYGVPEDQQDVLLAIAESMRETDVWWADHTDVFQGAHLEFLTTEPMATSILAYGATVLPELLQSEDYATAVAQARPGTSIDIADIARQASRCRQAEVLGETTVPFAAVIGEAALRIPVGDEDLQREQLRRLADTAATAWTTIQVLPHAAGPTAVGGCGSFEVLKFDPVPFLGLVHLDGPSGGVCLEAPAMVAAYADVFARLQDKALSPEASLNLIREVAER